MTKPDAVAAVPRTGLAKTSQVLVFKIDSRILPRAVEFAASWAQTRGILVDGQARRAMWPK
jgi:hypothetical protein